MAGVTKVVCPNELIKPPASAFEKAFYPNHGVNSSKMATQWLEYEAQKRGVHIHHDLCGHGGERYINNAPVDGYEPLSKTVFQFHGCTWHGCPKHSKQVDAKEVLAKTHHMEAKIRASGYQLVVMWQSRKPRITIRRAFQVGIAVYQLAKLRILEFYYDFIDKYVARQDYELLQMDTDSLYLGLSATTLDKVVRPELRAEFEEEKKHWLAWNRWSNRTPGLFKMEFEGRRAIALCSKCYYVDTGPGGKSKHSSKGMSQRHNDLTWGRYKAALEGSVDIAENRGFRMRDGAMTTYTQTKLGLSAYYDKRRVLPDGIHTEPLEYTLRGAAEMEAFIEEFLV
ncbi:hypothetical protein QZH41_003157 [Actinostola sp. cb2023]|nr:hypothetical protein QZH41_003157 [Actinostola sp. cb2023]